MPTTDLGAFLAVRRGQVLPESLAIHTVGPRRVTGLRRDEVARVAGVSEDYYRRLEQGKDSHPSRAVLDALSGVLSLTPHEQQYLYSLAGLVWVPSATVPVPTAELQCLVDRWVATGALVVDPLMDLVASNDRANQLFDCFTARRNLVDMVLRDPVSRYFFPNWEHAAALTVAALRAGSPLVRPAERLTALLERMGDDVTFVALWASHEVRPKAHERKRVRHPREGVIAMDFHAFGVNGAPGHTLHVYDEIRDPASHGGFRQPLGATRVLRRERSRAARPTP